MIGLVRLTLCDIRFSSRASGGRSAFDVRKGLSVAKMGRNVHMGAPKKRLDSVKARFLVALSRFAHNLPVRWMRHVRIERIFGQNCAFFHLGWLVRLAGWPTVGLDEGCGVAEG